MRFKRKKWFCFSDVGFPLPMRSHMSNPTPFYLGRAKLRIFFSSRNEQNKSSVCFFDVDMRRLEIINSEVNILLNINNHENCFFSDGVSLGNIFNKENKYFLSFMGWDLSDKKPWKGTVGVAEIDPYKPSILCLPEVPTIDTLNGSDSSLSYPTIKVIGDELYIWYGNTVKKNAGNGEMLHTIHLSVLKEGNVVRHKGQVIDYLINESQAFSRPSIIEHHGMLNMFYSVRGADSNYQINRSISSDGLLWKKADFHMVGAADPAESDMQCYPYVTCLEDDIYLFYNGNNYGRSGIGLAVLEQ